MKKDEPLKFTKGTIINFTGGCWDDTWTSHPYMVLKDIDEKEVVEGTCRDFKTYYPGFDDFDIPTEGPECQDLITFLVKNGYIEKFEPATRWYIGDVWLESPYLPEEYKND